MPENWGSRCEKTASAREVIIEMMGLHTSRDGRQPEWARDCECIHQHCGR